MLFPRQKKTSIHHWVLKKEWEVEYKEILDQEKQDDDQALNFKRKLSKYLFGNQDLKDCNQLYSHIKDDVGRDWF